MTLPAPVPTGTGELFSLTLQEVHQVDGVGAAFFFIGKRYIFLPWYPSPVSIPLAAAPEKNRPVDGQILEWLYGTGK